MSRLLDFKTEKQDDGTLRHAERGLRPGRSRTGRELHGLQGPQDDRHEAPRGGQEPPRSRLRRQGRPLHGRSTAGPQGHGHRVPERDRDHQAVEPRGRQGQVQHPVQARLSRRSCSSRCCRSRTSGSWTRSRCRSTRRPTTRGRPSGRRRTTSASGPYYITQNEQGVQVALKADPNFWKGKAAVGTRDHEGGPVLGEPPRTAEGRLGRRRVLPAAARADLAQEGPERQDRELLAGADALGRLHDDDEEAVRRSEGPAGRLLRDAVRRHRQDRRPRHRAPAAEPAAGQLPVLRPRTWTRTTRTSPRPRSCSGGRLSQRLRDQHRLLQRRPDGRAAGGVGPERARADRHPAKLLKQPFATYNQNWLGRSTRWG